MFFVNLCAPAGMGGREDNIRIPLGFLIFAVPRKNHGFSAFSAFARSVFGWLFSLACGEMARPAFLHLPHFSKKSQPHFSKKSQPPHFSSKSQPHFSSKSQPHFSKKSRPHFSKKSRPHFSKKNQPFLMFFIVF